MLFTSTFNKLRNYTYRYITDLFTQLFTMNMTNKSSFSVKKTILDFEIFFFSFDYKQYIQKVQ